MSFRRTGRIILSGSFQQYLTPLVLFTCAGVNLSVCDEGEIDSLCRICGPARVRAGSVCDSDLLRCYPLN